jgi:hypothetical protein
MHHTTRNGVVVSMVPLSLAVWAVIGSALMAFVAGALYRNQPCYEARLAASELTSENIQLRADTSLYGTAWRFTHHEYVEVGDK